MPFCVPTGYFWHHFFLQLVMYGDFWIGCEPCVESCILFILFHTLFLPLLPLSFPRRIPYLLPPSVFFLRYLSFPAIQLQCLKDLYAGLCHTSCWVITWSYFPTIHHGQSYIFTIQYKYKTCFLGYLIILSRTLAKFLRGPDPVTLHGYVNE